MKIYVIHDTAGNIVSTAAAAVEGQAQLVAGPGQGVAEVDVGAVRVPGGHEGQAADLHEISAHLIATHHIVHGKLTLRG
jgi:hypothetical protein